MNRHSARVWIIKASIVCTAITLALFGIAPVFDVLNWSDSRRLLEIIIPPFMGYLGMASHFVFKEKTSDTAPLNTKETELLNLLVKGPFYLFAIAVVITCIAFVYTNAPSASAGTGMSVDNLATSLSAALALLAVTTNIIVTRLFEANSEQAS